jgi:hypothetical protein
MLGFEAESRWGSRGDDHVAGGGSFAHAEHEGKTARGIGGRKRKRDNRVRAELRAWRRVQERLPATRCFLCPGIAFERGALLGDAHGRVAAL